MTESKIQLVMVTGMSGAGKTVAIQSFEDLGYFTIDNMPPALLLKFIELMRHSPDNNKLAVVVDMRSRSFFNEIRTILDELDNQEDLDFKVLFLDATDSELVARYKETRRSHPLAADGRVLDGITLERELLSPLKNISQNVVATTELTPRNLRKTIKIISQIFGLRSCHLVSNTAFRSMLTSSLTCVFFQIPTINWNFGI